MYFILYILVFISFKITDASLCILLQLYNFIATVLLYLVIVCSLSLLPSVPRDSCVSLLRQLLGNFIYCLANDHNAFLNLSWANDH